jgi:hypothetical protein
MGLSYEDFTKLREKQEVNKIFKRLKIFLRQLELLIKLVNLKQFI